MPRSSRIRTLDRFLPASLYGPARRRWTPRMAGRSGEHHVALTFDDGPDLRTTPTILATLERYGVTATFFVIGEHVGPTGSLLQEMNQAGHELAVHGWRHTCVARRRPLDLIDDLRRTCEAIHRSSSQVPQWYRPPYGIATRASAAAARTCGLETILWTAWGRDWSRWVRPNGIARRVRRTARPGGTVLLHDTDRYAAPGSWHRTDASLAMLVPRWQDDGVAIGPLGRHWAAADPVALT